MGQKTKPKSLRLAYLKQKKIPAWNSMWFASKTDYASHLKKDIDLRAFIMSRSCCQGVSKLKISWTEGKVEIVIETSKVGLVIGRKGAEIEALKTEIAKKTGLEVWVEVVEVKRPQLEAQLVAEDVARQLKSRIGFRRVIKKTLQQTIDAGALGVRIQIAGRLGGAEIARVEWDRKGAVPLPTLRKFIDYGQARAQTPHGILGIKVWINRGYFEEQEVKGTKA